jgi:hypothetical protein
LNPLSLLPLAVIPNPIKSTRPHLLLRHLNRGFRRLHLSQPQSSKATNFFGLSAMMTSLGRSHYINNPDTPEVFSTPPHLPMHDRQLTQKPNSKNLTISFFSSNEHYQKQGRTKKYSVRWLRS